MIYHYSSVENFLKIIQSKELWLFNSKKMNDSLETNWINHLIDKELIENREKIDKEKLDTIIQHYNINNWWSYLMCFSKDGDVLSQWRAYAKDGTGISIGFNENELEIDKKLPRAGAHWKTSTGICECIYDEEKQGNIIKSILNFDEINKSDWMYAANVAINLRPFSLVFKNPKFCEEQEIRIIHVPMVFSNKDNDSILQGNISDVKFILKGNDISSYFKIELKDKFNSKLIPKLYLGPKNKMNVDDLLFFLAESGLKETEVEHSKASYQ
jgi:hypothetical protein